MAVMDGLVIKNQDSQPSLDHELQQGSTASIDLRPHLQDLIIIAPQVH